ncbi:ATP phosphoribosyltransferase [Demequina sp. TTPB684]|uniref:ATP phosphoribosyltransferase n=1 Tax=unclassified Demequina TaxID=2620311 RepID=UPI001CF0DF8D|nr:MULTISPECIES: ATP phosphoribosyltransferase [unclassified Demequina]MCB2413108.1 ATP phosphoribosyltransferase [Demequina sp. TTPB684]UPU89270.1 ATP phosphoribosyltransferase [Demequina sp. TMPB413]
MLRIAVPNKGSLSDPAVSLLVEAGYKQRRDPRELVLTDARNDVEFFFLRPRDVAVYVGSGTVQAGITGRDLLLDSGAAATEILELGFGGSTFRYAAPAGEISQISQLAGKRVATSYEHLVDTHLRSFGIEADVVRLDGAVESSVRLGVADAVADVVSTGTTLKAAGLEVFGEPLLKSEAILIRANSVPDADVAVLAARLRGVLMARQYVLVDYDVPADKLEDAIRITPGFEAPTVTPLHGSDWQAVRVMVPRTEMNQVMDALYAAGARAILTTELLAVRV